MYAITKLLSEPQYRFARGIGSAMVRHGVERVYATRSFPRGFTRSRYAIFVKLPERKERNNIFADSRILLGYKSISLSSLRVNVGKITGNYLKLLEISESRSQVQ